MNPQDEIARLVLNPLHGDIRDDTWRALIIDVLLSANQGLTTEEMRAALSRRFDLPSVSPLILERVLAVLQPVQEVAYVAGKWQIEPLIRERLVAEAKKAQAVDDAMFASVVDRVAQITGYSLDAHQRRYIINVARETLHEVFETTSSTSVHYMRGSSQSAQILPHLHDILRRASDIVTIEIEHRLEITRGIDDALTQLFLNPPPEFSEGMLQAGIKHVMLRLVAVDPELTRLRAELFRAAPIMVDTNLMIASLCEGSDRHLQAQWILQAARDVGMPIWVSDYTLQEYHDALSSIDDHYRSIQGRELSARMARNDFAKTFFRIERFKMDWPLFVAKMKGGPDRFMAEWGATTVRLSEVEIKRSDLSFAMNIIRGLSNYEAFDRPEALIRHDAIHVIAIHRLREQQDRPFHAPWFVTQHRMLRRADEEYRKERRLPLNSTLSTEALFELLYPFLWSRSDRPQASKAFAQMLGSALIAPSAISAEAFANYTIAELGLGPLDEAALLSVIQDAHTRRILERDLEKGDVRVALATFVGALQESHQKGREVEQQQQTIQRLVKRVQQLEGALPVEMDAQRWTAGLAAVRAAATNDEKKTTLERFAADLIGTIAGMVVMDTNVRLAAEEIDLIVKNRAYSSWGDPVLVECKNWTRPVGKDEVVLFIDKLRKQRSSTGILIAREGITGTEYSDARLRLREALWEHGIRVIVLTIEDLAAIGTSDDLRDILETRWYNPTSVGRRISGT